MTSNGTRHFVKINACDHEAELARLNARIAELEARKPVVKEVVKEVTKEVVKTVATETAVWFDFDSAELTEEAKANLDKIATDKDLTITGYASPEGRKDYNLKLSERRAQAVADYLKSKGAKVTTVDGKGVADYSLFRVVTVK
ncbi:MAG: OmpA family protein [Bacteroidaceae bacterium]|nr:OmpA family protein [Bacteroidaceae bacterium]